MTNSNAKGGFFGKALAAACSLALVASLTPAAAVSAFAAQTAEDVQYLTLKVQQLDSNGNIVRQATQTLDYTTAANYMSSASSASAVFKVDDQYGVATATSSAASTVTGLFKNKIARTNDGKNNGDLLLGYSDTYIKEQNPTVTISSGYTDPAASLNVIPEFAQEVSFNWNDLENSTNFYEDTTATSIAWNGAKETTGAYIVNNGATAMRTINKIDTTTAKDVAKVNMEYASSNYKNGFTFITGLTANNAVNHNDAATTKMVQGVTNITVTFEYPGLQNTERIAGTNWDDTMVKTLDKAWESSKGTIDTFVVATAGGFEDALAASGFAGRLNAPLLMTDRNALTANTEKWIKEYKDGGENAKNPITIYLIGGNMAVSDEVQASLEAIKGVADTTNGAVVRIAGENSWDTALELYKFVKKNVTDGWDGVNPVIATSIGFQDALSVSPYTYAEAAPVILTTDKAVLSDKVAAELQGDIKTDITANKITGATIVGGTVVVSTVVNNQLLNIPIQRYAGTTAYDTSNDIAKALYKTTTFGAVGGKVGAAATFNNNTEVSMATGELYLDALSSCNYTGKNNEVLLLVNDTAENGTVAITDFLTQNGPNGKNPGALDNAIIFGGTAVVSDGVQILADAALQAPLY